MSEVRRCFVLGCSLKKLVMLAPLLRAGDLATNAGADTEDMFLRVCVPGQTLEPFERDVLCTRCRQSSIGLVARLAQTGSAAMDSVAPGWGLQRRS